MLGAVEVNILYILSMGTDVFQEEVVNIIPSIMTGAAGYLDEAIVAGSVACGLIAQSITSISFDDIVMGFIF